jgi:hypothetical protein
MQNDGPISCKVCVDRLLMDLESDLRAAHEKVVLYRAAVGEKPVTDVGPIEIGVAQAFQLVRRALVRHMTPGVDAQDSSSYVWNVPAHSGKCRKPKESEKPEGR